MDSGQSAVGAIRDAARRGSNARYSPRQTGAMDATKDCGFKVRRRQQTGNRAVGDSAKKGSAVTHARKTKALGSLFRSLRVAGSERRRAIEGPQGKPHGVDVGGGGGSKPRKLTPLVPWCW